MSVNPDELNRRIERLTRAVRSAGLKLTHQRMEIFREVAQAVDHPDAEKVFQRVRKRMPTVSLDTVYRTLWMLSDLGLMKAMGPGREATRFDANLAPHHHFVCIRCDMTMDFDIAGLEAKTLSNAASVHGKVMSTHIEAQGVCRACAKSKDKLDSESVSAPRGRKGHSHGR